MNSRKAGIEEIIGKYQTDTMELSRYLPWLENKRGEKLSESYYPSKGEGTTMMFPVFDGTLMNFVGAAEKTVFINRNYMYSMKKYGMKSANDELKFIEGAQITDMQVLGDILSSYIIKGRVRGLAWTEGVKNGVYLAVITKMKELIEFWTSPF